MCGPRIDISAIKSIILFAQSLNSLFCILFGIERPWVDLTRIRHCLTFRKHLQEVRGNLMNGLRTNKLPIPQVPERNSTFDELSYTEGIAWLSRVQIELGAVVYRSSSIREGIWAGIELLLPMERTMAA